MRYELIRFRRRVSEPRFPWLREIPGGRLSEIPSGAGDAVRMSNGSGVANDDTADSCQPSPNNGGMRLKSSMPVSRKRSLWSVMAGPRSASRLKGFDTGEIPSVATESSDWFSVFENVYEAPAWARFLNRFLTETTRAS